MDGANDIWANVCIEGGAMGNASSCVTILNLIRFGNKKVQKRCNCKYLQRAAINVTTIITGVSPHRNQRIYGARALDFVLDKNPEDFDVADFFGEETPVRISAMASAEVIRQRLVDLFGEDEKFTLDVATRMKNVFAMT